MNGSQIDSTDVSVFRDTVVQMAQEYGYHRKDGRVLVDYATISGGLTVAEVIYALYNHVAIAYGYSKKSLEEITKELEGIKATDNTSSVTISGSTVPVRIGKIGDVLFECDITHEGIDITLFEKYHGSMADFVRRIWRKRIEDLAAISAQSKKFKTVEV